jgi:hypothetical protein
MNNTYYRGTHTVAIPDRAINVRITIAGSQGGNGGVDGNNSGGTRGPGRKKSFRLNNTGFSRTLYFYIGKSGGNASSGSNTGRGSGGSGGVASGGRGGNPGPQGWSGGGGGGGAASGVYDTYAGQYIIVAGGGGGGGGASYPDSYLRGGNGNSSQFLSYRSSISSGSQGTSQSFDGGGGGGGGGGARGGAGGREGADRRAGGYASTGGRGGGSYYVSSYVTSTGGDQNHYGDGYATLQYDLATPTFNSFTVSRNPIIRGDVVSFSWSTTYTSFISRMTLTSPEGTVYTVTGTTSISLQPQVSGTWTVRLYYSGGSHQAYIGHIVYIPPTITLELSDNPIPLGTQSKLSWSVSGDATSINIQPGIGNSNLSSFQQVAPTQTTTYTAYANGPAGSATEEVTLTVWTAPELSLAGPFSVDYGNNVTLTHSQIRSTSSYNLTIVMTDLDYNVTTETVDLGASQETSQTTYTHVIPWHSRGPANIQYTTVGVGVGGLTEQSILPIVNCNIDRDPDAFDVPESEEKIRDEAPVITPDVEVTTLQVLVTDIDIPVKIKADAPIQVEIDNSGIFVDVERI